jgi:ABC-type transporter lipoprotein component MlaA
LKQGRRELVRYRLTVLTGLTVLTLAVAMAPLPARALSDPLEPFNRLIHGLNGLLRDGAASGREALQGFTVLKAAAEISPPPRPPSRFENEVVAPVRAGLDSLFANLREPVTALSSLLVADTANARRAASRFVLNTTLGFGGVRDAARLDYGIESRPRDLGQVVCTLGLPEGPYLMLPLLGPSTLPEIGGRILTIVAGYQLFGRPYFRYRAADRVTRLTGAADSEPVDPAPAPLLIGTDAAADLADPYLMEKRRFEQSHAESCRPPAAPPAKGPPLRMVDHSPVAAAP